ncbi:MAG: phosphotransferase [Lachnospiraceae bacterium]|nr:phosphotransferase [Lachnospiraceae bacterium]
MEDLIKCLSELISKCELGRMLDAPQKVSGGLLHKMYKVRTEKGTYAVKILNPEIMKRQGVFENYRRAEELEDRLDKAGIRIVSSLVFDGKKMIECEGKYFYIFNWLEGSITDWNSISRDQCFKAGEILGKIHGLDAHNAEKPEPEIRDIDFAEYKKIAEEKNSEIAVCLNENLTLLEEAQRKLNVAEKMLPAMRAVDDSDMDPKNIMWNEGIPYVIDLECLDYGNPISSCLNLSLQWAGTVNGKYSEENLKAFYEGYLKSYDNGFRSYDELFGTAYIWVEWLEYNIRRALGMEGSNGETIALGTDEVKNTINRIRYLNSIEKDVCRVLGDLPSPDPEKYDTHDDSLCYIDLTFKGDITDKPVAELPNGYRFVNYSDGDKKAWIDIELSAGEILDKKHGEECWQRYYGSCEDELTERMIFIENRNGEKVATATAFYDIHGNSLPGEGRLHWVGIKKEAQGKGLSKPLITYTLGVMRNLGYNSTKIHTQTNTWLACKIYHDLGFRPDEDSIERDRFGWKMVRLLTKEGM